MTRRTEEEREMIQAAHMAIKEGNAEMPEGPVAGMTVRTVMEALNRAQEVVDFSCGRSAERLRMEWHEHQISRFGAVLWSLALAKVMREINTELHDARTKEAEDVKAKRWFNRGWG